VSVWDPAQYLRFADHRRRPGVELLARIPEVDGVEVVVDLGCGTGGLTALLAARWPEATVTGIDSSPEMLQRATADHASLAWRLSPLESWEPDAPVDVIYSNAALHWLNDHETLFPRLFGLVRPGGVLAVQMPANFSAPTHRIPAEILDGGDWSDAARAALLRDRVAAPSAYRRLLGAEAAALDIWTTTYHQELTGPDPVLEWVKGSVLAPVLAALGPDRAHEFATACAARYRDAYPPEPDGTVVLPFTRLFLVAVRSHPTISG
jgi:trans-aconitate 2-methyltransferase